MSTCCAGSLCRPRISYHDASSLTLLAVPIKNNLTVMTLCVLCSAILATHLEDMATTCKERLVRLVGMEERDIFTMNTHYFVDAKAAFLSRLKKANLPQVEIAYTKVGCAPFIGKSFHVSLTSYIVGIVIRRDQYIDNGQSYLLLHVLVYFLMYILGPSSLLWILTLSPESCPYHGS